MMHGSAVMQNPNGLLGGLWEYNIRHGSVLSMQMRVPPPVPFTLNDESGDNFRIHLKFNGLTKFLVVNADMRMRHVSHQFMSIPNYRATLFADDGFAPEHLRFRLNDQLTPLDLTQTVRECNIQRDDDIKIHIQRPGGAKKGCKRTISKEERMTTMRAKSVYQASKVAQQSNAHAVINQISSPQYVEWAVMQMSLAEVTALDQKAQTITRSDKVAEGIDTLIVPLLAQKTREKEQLEQEIKSLSLIHI